MKLLALYRNERFIIVSLCKRGGIIRGVLLNDLGGFRLRGHGGFDLRAASKKTSGLNLAKNIV